MAKTDYTELDAAILAMLPATNYQICVAVDRIAKPLATPDCAGRRLGWRVVDRRLQALRKRGLIKHGGGAWELVPKEGA